jgi:hypothetical protein
MSTRAAATASSKNNSQEIAIRKNSVQPGWRA